MPVEVRVPKVKMDGEKFNCLNSIHLIQDLKEKGVPMVGNIMIQGVRYGTLTLTAEGKDYVFRWEDDEL